MKVLFVATVRSHIGQFHMPFIKRLKELGCTVDAAYRDNSADKPGLDTSAIDHVYEVPFSRSPYSLDNVKAYKILKKILKNNDYDAVHCHTPMGAVVTRLAARSLRKKGLKVIYTAHGFHFYKGASSFNWKFFYPVEKYLSKYTDCLITINQEDYNLAKNEFYAKKICKINGVGVELDKFHPIGKEEKSLLRDEYGYSADDFILIYPANLTAEKNHIMLFGMVKLLKERGYIVKLLCPGQTELIEEFEKTVIEMGIDSQVEFLGYRRDIEKLAGLSDVSVSSSVREGLPVNIIEAMALGNAVVATNVRGNRDVIENGINGFLVEIGEKEKMADRISELIEHPYLLEKFGNENAERAKAYSTQNVNLKLLEIYKSLNLI